MANEAPAAPRTLPPPDSDLTPLEQRPRLSLPRPWRRRFETVAVIGSLFFGGVGSGFIWASRLNEAEEALLREDHLAEIGRLQEAYDLRQSRVAAQLSDVAGAVANAAQIAEDAADRADAKARAARRAQTHPKPEPQR